MTSALLIAFALTGCGGSGGGTGDPTATPPSGSEIVGESPPTPAASPDAAAELDDGQHPGYIKELDVDDLTVTFDLVVFLTGEEAIAEYQRRNPGATDGPLNHTLIVNDNPRLRTLPIAPDVVVVIVAGVVGNPQATQEISLAQLAAMDLRWDKVIFWVTVTDGKVTKIEEQWVP